MFSSSSSGSETQQDQQSKLYIGNLPFSVDDNALKVFFEATLGAGSVESAQVVIDRERRRSKGFGFVTFSSPEIAEKATSMNGQEIEGAEGSKRPISIDKAHERKSRKFRGNGGFNHGGYGGGSSGGYGGGNDWGGNRGGGNNKGDWGGRGRSGDSNFAGKRNDSKKKFGDGKRRFERNDQWD